MLRVPWDLKPGFCPVCGSPGMQIVEEGPGAFSDYLSRTGRSPDFVMAEYAEDQINLIHDDGCGRCRRYI